MRKGVFLIEVKKLKVHEETSRKRVLELTEKIVRDGYIKNPVVVEGRHLVVLDGHHRLAALKSLGMKRIPVFLVDYQSSRVRVYLRRGRLPAEVIKELVIARALNGRVLPQKTTRHLVTNRVRNAGVKLGSLR